MRANLFKNKCLLKCLGGYVTYLLTRVGFLAIIKQCCFPLKKNLLQ